MQMSYEQYLKATEKKQNNSNANLPTYFSLKDDGESAIVRFDVSKIEDISIYTRHMIKSNGKLKAVECLRMPDEPKENCPLCASGNKANTRIYIKVIVYENEGEKVTYKPCIWEQSITFRNLLKSYIMDYGDLRDTIFKVTRTGKKGDTSTRYSIIPANPQIYREENYPKDFSAFDNFNLNSYMLLKKSKEELNYFLETGSLPAPATKGEATSINNMNSVNLDKPSNNVKYEANRSSTVSNRERIVDIPKDEPIRTSYNVQTKEAIRVNTVNENNATEVKTTPSPRRYTY